jgi:hypothetical protein
MSRIASNVPLGIDVVAPHERVTEREGAAHGRR